MNLFDVNNESVSTIEDSFEKIATTLFNDYKINVNDHWYRLLEIEFYYNNNSNFKDPYIHFNDLQKEQGCWYFHRSGIDITFGNKDIYGGILIRRIAKVSKEAGAEKSFIEFEVDGPIKVKQELTKHFNGVLDAKPNAFELVNSSRDKLGALMPKAIFELTAKRVGLNLKDEDINGEFFHKRYRYIAYLENFIPNVKGKELLYKELKELGKLTADEVEKLLTYKSSAI